MLKKEKGITLIVLVITIIVMLILVIVTINIAINGNLFGKARKSSADTEKQAILETIIGSVMYADDGKIIVTGTEGNSTKERAIVALAQEGKPAEATKDTAAEVILKVEGKTGTYYYKITETEIVIWHEEGNTGGNNSGEETLEWYEFREVNGVNEKATIEASDYCEDGYYGIAVKYGSGNNYTVMAFLSQGKVLYVDCTFQSTSNRYTYCIDSSVAEEENMETNQWYVNGGKYTTKAVPQDFNEVTDQYIICPSYYNRLLASFTE